MLVRIGKKGASWETESLDEFLEAEFSDRRTGRPDLEISLYEIDRDELARTIAEHMASANLRPHPREHHFDVTEAVRAEGLTPSLSANSDRFEHVREHHVVVRFQTPDDQRRFVERVFDGRGEARVDVAKSAVLDYVANKLEHDDAEWARFFNHARHGGSWRDKAEKRLKKREEEPT